MKILYKQKIGEQTIVQSIAGAVVDTAKTMEKISALIAADMTEAERQIVFNDNLVYAMVGEEAELIEDTTAGQIQAKLDAMGDNKKLLENGEYIEDHRGVEYWIKNSGTWLKEKIEEIGVPLPAVAILQENITPEQQKEIYDQQEEERLASLTPEQRAKERIAVLKRELAETDYIAAKIAEGSATVDEYADAIAQRQTWRQEINSLEEVLT